MLSTIDERHHGHTGFSDLHYLPRLHHKADRQVSQMRLAEEDYTDLIMQATSFSSPSTYLVKKILRSRSSKRLLCQSARMPATVVSCI